MEIIPREVQKLIEEREKLRRAKRYKESDALREKIEALGYELRDAPEGTEVSKTEEYTAPKKSSLVLFGSGEISATGARIHNSVFEKMEKDEISIAVISTPAGFQPNVKVVYEEIAEFFVEHLANYHPKIDIIYANTKEQANDPRVFYPLDTADYIFTGPGSPTYAIDHLRNTLLCEKIGERVAAGVTLSLASAATIAFSHFALPVYEIYKVGTPLHWKEGLNFYPPFFQELTIIPHFNNREGGKKTDTSHCYMGKERFETLFQMLPPQEHVWGIDEHTAAIVDLKTKQVRSMGKGKLRQLR
ncbi:MAG: cysteinyl-tRNA synthetase [Patescibacteria group bacterium]